MFSIATPTTQIYTLSLHDALPIWQFLIIDVNFAQCFFRRGAVHGGYRRNRLSGEDHPLQRSEEHTSELQSHVNLVCRLLLEKKKTQKSSTAVFGGGLQLQGQYELV